VDRGSIVRLPNTAHTSFPWRIHELTRDLRLEDVWALPTPGGPDDFPRLVEQFASGDPSQSPSAAVRTLFAIRWRIGELLGWDRPNAGLDSRVREVEPAEGVDRALEQSGDLGLVRHVADDGQRLVARGGQLLGRRLDALLVVTREHDGGPGLGERLRGGQPDARAGAGDERNAVLEVVGRVRVIRGAHGRTITLIDPRSAIAR